jgi:hypothetical protein
LIFATFGFQSTFPGQVSQNCLKKQTIAIKPCLMIRPRLELNLFAKNLDHEDIGGVGELERATDL